MIGSAPVITLRVKGMSRRARKRKGGRTLGMEDF